ncbi:MAG: hypothetical protein JST48_05500 [Bacteroidetes bacterium]|nr:hypothetical protein [Bacteroidota bacterium]
MDSKRIEELLEKYWSAETSLTEEQELRYFFQNDRVPEHLKEVATLFNYFGNEKTRVLEGNFEIDVTKKTTQRHGGKVVAMKDWFSIAKIAAGVVVIVAAVYLIGREVRNSSPAEIADTESDPKLAFEETKKALLMISKNFQKAQREASKINLLNEAEKKIERKEENENDSKVNI